MLVPERRARLLELVRSDGSARVDRLASALGVSAWTIRRDLADLTAQGLLSRAHGGAYVRTAADRARARDGSGDRPTTPETKRRIAAAAASRIRDGSTIMVLAGSTTSALLPHLRTRRLTVVTNGLDVAGELRDAPHVSLVVIGGYLHRDQMTLIGPMSEAAMADLHVDVIVAGAHGIDPQIGVTGAKIVQAGYHRAMLQHTNSLMVLADSSKLGRSGPTVLAQVGDVDTLVTDDAAPTDVVEALRAAGVDVVLAAEGDVGTTAG